MVLSRVEVYPDDQLESGSEAIVDLTFLSARPLTVDGVAKVDILGPGYAWRAPSDHIPATGAIPTLKWLHGWRIIDRHRLAIPARVDASSARAEIAVYDHFTGALLPILDPVLAREGITISIYWWDE